MGQELENRPHLAKSDAAPRFAVWPHLTPGDIFSEDELPQPRLMDSPLPSEKGTTGADEDGGLRPFLTEDDVTRWRDTEVHFGDLDTEQRTGQLALPEWLIEEYRRMDPNLVVTIPDSESLQRWEDDGGALPTAREYSEPPTLRRKDFWSQYGPVRYRLENSGRPPLNLFLECFPPEAIGQIPFRPGIEERVRRRLDSESGLPKCALGRDWNGNRLFALADARRKIEGRRMPTVLHALAFAAYEVEKVLIGLYPSLPAAAMAEFCESYDLYRHLCYFARAIERYSAQLGRPVGLMQDEIHRGLLCIWDQLGDYANKVRSAVVARTDPATKQETKCEQHAGRDARATPEAPVALLSDLHLNEAKRLADPSLQPEVDARSPEQAARAKERQAVVIPILERKKWTRNKLAIKAAVSPTCVNEYLDGKRRRLTAPNHKAIADALGIEPKALPN